MAIANTPQIKPQSVPLLEDRGGDTSLPPLLSRVWWLFLNSVADFLGSILAELQAFEALDFVFGGSKLTVGVIPKAAALKALTDSAISDDGTNVTVASRPLVLNQTISGAAQPMLELVAGGTDKTRFTRTTAAVPRADILVNISFDGTNFNLDDIAKPGLRISFNTVSGILFTTFTAGANPRTETIEFKVDPSGIVNTPGVYEVGGVQVVKAPGLALTGAIAYGGGVFGATYTAVERALGNDLISQATNLKTRLDQLEARLSLAAGGHGLIA